MEGWSRGHAISVFRGTSSCDVADAGPIPQQAVCSTPSASDDTELYHSRVSISICIHCAFIH